MIGLSSMTVGTAHFAFLYLNQDRAPRVVPGEHLINLLCLGLRIDVVKLHNNWIVLTTIDTLSH